MWYPLIETAITMVIVGVAGTCPQEAGQLDPKLVFPLLCGSSRANQ